MSRYCDICMLAFDGEVCPVCGRKSDRQAKPDDLCFLVEKEQLWSGMLADVLEQHKIHFIQKNVLGAGLAAKIGQVRERVRFYVFFEQLPEATDIVNKLFSSPFEGDGNED